MRGHGKIAGLLLAAGRGQRFGGGKLDFEFRGKPLGLHAAEGLASAVGDGERVAVAVPGATRLRPGLDALGYRVIENGVPELGLSHSILLAISTIFSGDSDGLMIVLGDMPCVPVTHLSTLIETFSELGGNEIVASAAGSARSPPAIIPRRLWANLFVLSGDEGAKALLQGAVVVNAEQGSLMDVDSRADLSILQP